MKAKYCPTCDRKYSEDLNFCLEDGSALLTFGEIPPAEGPPTLKISDATVEELTQMHSAARGDEQESTEDSPAERDDQLTFYLNNYAERISDDASSTDSKIILRHSKFSYQGEDHIFEELILHENYGRLWRSLIRAKGGCNLLTGYGPFGGTSLVQCAVVKARTELQKFEGSEAALLVFHFRIKNEAKDSFEIEATKFGLGYLNSPQDAGHNSDLEALRMRAEGEQTGDSLLELQLDQPIGATFFKPSSLATQTGVNIRSYDFSNLLADLNAFFKQKRTTNELRRIVLKLIKSKHLPSRVVFIIDRVRYLETLETLAKSEFFSNKRIRVIVISREEDFDCWENASERLEQIGFSKWYVPCLWELSKSEVLFDLNPGENSKLKEAFNIFLKHLKYKGRGSLGNIIAELRQPVNIDYGNSFNYIDAEDLTERADVQHNAWMQDVLDMNWATILGDLFGGVDQDKKTDRARIGIYYLIDWIARATRFSRAALLDVAAKTRITISDDLEIRGEAIDRLLEVLVQNEYLRYRENTYRVIWNKNNLPKCRNANYKWSGSVGNFTLEPTAGSQGDSASKASDTSPSVVTNAEPAAPTSISPKETSAQPPRLDFLATPVGLSENAARNTKTFRSKKVFISYSHEDERWLNRLKVHLSLIERQGLIEPWDDSRITTGANWKEEIKKAISSAKIAILLVSGDFLGSEFIVNDELPPLLAAAATEGTVILPLIVSPCMFLNTNLSQFQAFNDPSKPLSSMTRHQRERVFVKAAEHITKVVFK